MLVWPKDRKESDILRARYRPRINRTAQVIVPEDVVMDLLGMLFKVKLFFDANVIMVSVATSLFLGLVVLLTLRIRKREMETLFKIGCSRLKVFSVMGTELSIIVIAGLVVAAALSAGVYAYVARSGLIP